MAQCSGQLERMEPAPDYGPVCDEFVTAGEREGSTSGGKTVSSLRPR